MQEYEKESGSGEGDGPMTDTINDGGYCQGEDYLTVAYMQGRIRGKEDMAAEIAALRSKLEEAIAGKTFWIPTENWPEAHQYNDLENLRVYETDMDEEAIIAVSKCTVARECFAIRIPIGDGDYDHELFDTREEAEKYQTDMKG